MLVTCPGCNRYFRGPRGLRSHQSQRGVTLACKRPATTAERKPTPTAQKIITHATDLGFHVKPGTIAGVNETTFYVFDNAGKFVCDVFTSATVDGCNRRTIITIRGGHTTDLRGILHIMTNRALSD